MQSTVVTNYFKPDKVNYHGSEYYLDSDSKRYAFDGFSPNSLHSNVQALIRKSLSSTDPTPGWGWWYVGDARPPKLEPADHHMFGHRHTVKTPDFKERCSKGEILMNDYKVCKGILTYGPSQRSELLYDTFISWSTPSVGSAFMIDNNRPHKVERYGWWYDERAPFAFVNGTWMKSAISVYDGQFELWQNAITVGKPRDSRVNLVETGKYLESLPQEIEHVTVQEVLAKANGGDLDVLTSLAEMPELIASIVDGFKLIKKIFQDAKKKEFRVYATVPDRARRLAATAFAKKKAKALRKIPTFESWSRRNPGSTIQDYKHWRSDRIDRINDFEKFLQEKGTVYTKRALREIAEMLASIHLNVMYNIKPTVYMIEDCLKAIDEFGNVYRRYGNGNTPVVTELDLHLPGVPEAKFEGVAKTEFRCLIKRRYAMDTLMSKINSTLVADVLVTGFELIRLWSIVFDWFFTISDALRALPWNRNYVQQAACVSWKTEINGSFTWRVGSTNHTLKVEMERFDRSLYNPVHSIGIFFRDNFGLNQQLSALAFSFQALNGSIRKRYSYT